VATARVDTFAEGIATRTTFDLTFDLLKARLDDVITVTDDELRDSVMALLTRTHNVVEGAGAAGLAAARQYASLHGPGGRVVCVVSGGNLDVRTLSGILALAGASVLGQDR
jgi:threonine dehydratase